MERLFPVGVYQSLKKTDDYSVVAILETHMEAETAVKRLQQSGIDLKNCSIVGKENTCGDQIIGFYCAGDRVEHWGKLGAFWGGVWGLLGGSAIFLIPGVGPVIMGGTFVTAMIGALEGAVIIGGLSSLGAAFYNMGIPPDSVPEYEIAIKKNRFVVIVHGNSAEITQAKAVLESSVEKSIPSCT